MAPLDPLDLAELQDLLARLERLLGAERAEVERAALDRSRLTTEIDVLVAERDALDREATAALDAGDDDGARAALSKLLSAEHRRRDVELRLRGAVRRHETMSATLEEHERALGSVKERVAALPGPTPAPAQPGDALRSEVELELLRRKKRREPAAGEAVHDA